MEEEAAAGGGYYAHHFEEVCTIGRGSFGSVHVCRHVVADEVVGIFAVKKIPVGTDASLLRKVLVEVKMLERVSRHPNVIQYHHAWVDVARTCDFGPKVRCLFILMEYAAHGSLDSLIKSCGDRLTDDAVWYFFLSVLRGLQYLHDRGILHRDLKADNVLLASNYADDGFMDVEPATSASHDSFAGTSRSAPRPVLADFGTSAFMPSPNLRPEELRQMAGNRTGGTGTEEYMAPELMETPTGCGAVHTVSSDLFAMGVLLHQLAFGGAFPLPLDDATSRSRIRVSSNSRNRPTEMADLISALLQPDPKHRPASCSAILDVPKVQEKWKSVTGLRSRDITREDSLVAQTPRVHAKMPALEGPPKLLLGPTLTDDESTHSPKHLPTFEAVSNGNASAKNASFLKKNATAIQAILVAMMAAFVTAVFNQLVNR